MLATPTVIDEGLAGGVRNGFTAVVAELDRHRIPGQLSGFMSYPTLSKAAVTGLAQAVVEPLPRVAGKVVCG